ncbi:RNA polymerase sigma factor [Streptomyces sp. NPDC058739]|uniref:RNA polymerase sigma factor n=1 Tax=Streptomyces sp. NPDC058739 TaxID=3346618 RepID=UPI0036BCEECD
MSPAEAGRESSRPAYVPPASRPYREADRRVYEHLQKVGFQGPHQELLETRLMMYSRPVLTGWIITGEIYNRVKDIGRPVSKDAAIVQRLQESPDARDDLVQDTLITALSLFREQLFEDKWDAELGSLTTYFLGAVVRSFPNVYRAWARRQMTEDRVEPMGVTPEELSPIEPADTEDYVSTSVEAREAAERFFKMLKSPDREVAQMVYDGTPINEIATQFRVTPDAIRRRLRRMKEIAVVAELG